MNILVQITQFLELLDSNKTDLDFNELKFILSEAYTTTRQGLELSNDAGKYRVLKKDFDAIKTDYQTIKDELDSTRKLNLSLAEENKNLAPILESLKNSLKGRVSLISNYSKDKKNFLTSKIDNCKSEELVELKIQIENDFDTNWEDKSPESFKAEENKEFVDFSPFKFGA